MTFLAPGFLYGALAAALATIALHLIATREPRAVMLPTARFIPESSARAVVRAARFSDPWLLALRVLLLLLLGIALARPVRVPQRERIARVILADRSAAVASDAELRDSVRSLYRQGDAIVSFDSAARYTSTFDSLPPAAGSAVGSLSAALVQAHAAASRIRAGADSIELVLVSPIAAAEVDRATAHIRRTWPGRARLVSVARDTTHSTGAATIDWGTPASNPSPGPARASERQTVDTTGAVIAGGDVIVAPFVRRWSFPSDSLRGAMVIARWMDGEPAAVEWSTSGAGVGACARSIVIPIDSTGDLVLRPEFIRLRDRLRGACGAARTRTDSVPSASLATMMTGSGSLAPADAFPPGPSIPSTLAPWLLALALLLALAEPLVRRSRGVR